MTESSDDRFAKPATNVIGSAMLDHRPPDPAQASSSPLEPKQQLHAFLSTLFARDDRIELRLIENSPVGTQQRTRVVARSWLTQEQIVAAYPRIHDLNSNKAANVYFGVNPRSNEGGRKADVSTCRSIWADLDNISLPTLDRQWPQNVPIPSVVVSSGHGVHLYWLLDRPCHLNTESNRNAFESMLKRFYSDLGSDSTQDVTRLLRLPGFMNCKKAPVPCDLVTCDPAARYDIRIFEPWMRPEVSPSLPRAPTSLRSELPAAINAMIHGLDAPARDRSRRDFRVVCDLIRLGFSKPEIWSLVQEHSKFKDRGPAYFESTHRNATRAITRLDNKPSLDR